MRRLNHFDIIQEGFKSALFSLTKDALETALPKASGAVKYGRGVFTDAEVQDRLKQQVSLGVKKLKNDVLKRDDFINHISDGLKKILKQSSVLTTNQVDAQVEAIEKKFKYTNLNPSVDLRREKTNIIEDFLTEIYQGCLQRDKSMRRK